MRHFLDVHAAFAGGHHGDLLGATIGDDGDVVFLLDVGALFDIETANLLACGPGLVRDQLHAEHVAGELLHVLDGLGHLHTTALATAAGMNLCLDHPHGASQLLGGFHGFLHGECRNSPWDRHAELTQDFLALILMNLHAVLSTNGKGSPETGPEGCPEKGLENPGVNVSCATYARI